MATEKRNLLKGDFSKKNALLFALAVLVTTVLWNLPTSSFGIEGLTVIQQRIIAVFALATILWVTEAISPWATSVSLIGLLLFTTSDNAFHFFRSGIEKEELLDHSALMATFADPIIILFLGGFILAIAATKSGLDVLLARTLLKPFGNKSENVLLGFILITGVFSMFVSNTATAAMMLTFLAPVFKALPPEGKGRVALTLSIPVAANIGGMGTPIGTPPNAIALKYLNSPTGLNLGIGFGEWMMYMLPLTIVLLLIGWFLLKKFFPSTSAPEVPSYEMTAQAGDDRAIFWGEGRSYEIENITKSAEGYGVCKFLNYNSDNSTHADPTFADMDWPFMRAAEAYLNYAEADARLNGGKTSQEGTRVLNKLRARANASTRAESSNYSLNEICDEWAREFYFEGMRRTTLVRFNLFGGNTGYNWDWKGGESAGKNFEAYKNIYPIPLTQLQSNTNLKQNPGYTN